MIPNLKLREKLIQETSIDNPITGPNHLFAIRHEILDSYKGNLNKKNIQASAKLYNQLIDTIISCVSCTPDIQEIKISDAMIGIVNDNYIKHIATLIIKNEISSVDASIKISNSEIDNCIRKLSISDTMTTELRARKALLIFPESYSLKEAYEMVSRWKPDLIKYDLINNNPHIYVTRSTKIQQRVKNDIIFKTGKDLVNIPSLNNPSLDIDTEEVNALKLYVENLKTSLNTTKRDMDAKILSLLNTIKEKDKIILILHKFLNKIEDDLEDIF